MAWPGLSAAPAFTCLSWWICAVKTTRCWILRYRPAVSPSCGRGTTRVPRPALPGRRTAATSSTTAPARPADTTSASSAATAESMHSPSPFEALDSPRSPGRYQNKACIVSLSEIRHLILLRVDQGVPGAFSPCQTGQVGQAEKRQDTIEQRATEPESAEADGVRVKQGPLKDLIEVDKHLVGKTAAGGKSPRLLVNRIVPPGSV